MSQSRHSPGGRWRRRALSTVAALSVVVGTPALAAIPASASTRAHRAVTISRVRLAASAAGRLVSVEARPALPTGARSIGSVPAGQHLSGDVALRSRDADGLRQYATAISQTGSGLYHRYVPAATFGARFGASGATLRTAERTLRSDGLTVSPVADSRLLLRFGGTAKAVAATFHTGFARYRLRGGRVAFANTGAAELPAALAPEVQAVIGLNDLLRPQADPPRRVGHPAKANAPAAPAAIPGAPTACSAAQRDASAYGGLTDQSIAYAYGLDPLYRQGALGQGSTVAILDLYGYRNTDLQRFDDCYFGTTDGPKVYGRLSADKVDGGAQFGAAAGGSVETTLDAEDVQAVAPGANVVVYEAPPTDYAFVDDIAEMNAGPADVETISYGECEPLEQRMLPGYIQVENTLFEQAAAEGKTVLSSSADNGSDTCSADSGAPVAPVLSVSDPASQPFVTAVGGTAILDATDPPTEEVWNDGAAGGAGGGGISSVWPAPAWQAESKVAGFDNATVVRAAERYDGDDFCLSSGSDLAGQTCREVPDVSAQASPNTGEITIFFAGHWTVIGGTSSSSPLWAGMLADIDSSTSPVAAGRTCEQATGGVGFVSPELYGIASVPAEYAASFNDVTVGNNDNFGVAGGLFPATRGYDMATGLGSPRVTGPDGARGLSYYLCDPPESTPTVTGLVPQVLAVSGGTVTVHGSGFETGSASDVAGVTVGSYQVPAADITVASATQLTLDPAPPAADLVGHGGIGAGTGSYDVTVTLTGGVTSAPSAASRLIYQTSPGGSATPAVLGVEPPAGPEVAPSSPYTVTLYGSGYSTGTPTVTFGGVASTAVTVVADDELTARVPAYTPGTTRCASFDLPAAGVCQTQVIVTIDGHASPTATIARPFNGAYADITPTTKGTYQVSSEFDYFPAPHITSTAVVGGGLADTGGGSLLELEGSGFNYLGFMWANVGLYSLGSSFDYSLEYIGSTHLTIVLPPEEPASAIVSEPVSVQAYGSPNLADVTASPPSNIVHAGYAPTPTVSKSTTGSAYQAGPTSGGTKLTVSGRGLDGVEAVLFTDIEYGFTATAYPGLITSDSNTKVVLTTPTALVGKYAVSVCTASGCSEPRTGAVFTFYLPGNPKVTSSTPESGPAGTKVTIRGGNLGNVAAVYFGTVKSTKIANGPAFFESGNTNEVIATAPKGVAAGRKVDIRVETLESLAGRSGKSPVAAGATFTYKK